ncbi:hypothetical protein DRW03_10495 [Corallococcus sp. H22C18031201]|nr:hypothetical protein DRW03_10495 [Corallococcus sp. H22C18031201]
MDDATTNRFWAVWNELRPQLLKLSLQRTGGHWADAEDALSIAMLRALQAFDARQHDLNSGTGERGHCT